MTEQEELVMDLESKYKIIEFVTDALKKAIDKQDGDGILYIARTLGEAHKMALDYCPGGKHVKVVIVEDWVKH